MSDPIADMITQIRNGYLAKKKSVAIPYSVIKEKLAEVILKEGFLSKMEVVGQKAAEKKIVLRLKYQNREPVLTKIKRISKPGQRVYARAGKIPLVKEGFGVTIISNSSGLMTNHQARKKNLGGEVVCQVW